VLGRVIVDADEDVGEPGLRVDTGEYEEPPATNGAVSRRCFSLESSPRLPILIPESCPPWQPDPATDPTLGHDPPGHDPVFLRDAANRRQCAYGLALSVLNQISSTSPLSQAPKRQQG